MRHFPPRTREALQTPFDFAVVITSILRPSLRRALQGIYEQRSAGRIQVLIGVDIHAADSPGIEALIGDVPPHVTVSVLDPGYSTSERNGGLHASWDGGALRTTLTLLANARRIAVLDDDCWWHPDHLHDLRAVLDRGVAWAFALRWLVETETLRTVCVDRWHSTGPDSGLFREKLGGFVDPNVIAFDKLRAMNGLHLWALGPKSAADRRFSSYLISQLPGAGTTRATVYYTARPTNVLWSLARADGALAG
jgi:hypothetical protein